MTNSAYNKRAVGPGRREDALHELREKLAELEHEQWCNWSRSVAETEVLAPERLEAWRRRWVPYAELSEDDKDMDREYADRVLGLLRSRRALATEDTA